MRHEPSIRRTRQDLTGAELQVLDCQVIPTARRWLRIPGLAEKGAQTLSYWGEDLIDDHGQPYRDG